MKKNKKDIRKNFKTEVFKRDKYCCLMCGEIFTLKNADEFLDAHHIKDRNEIVNGGYVKENGISLCKSNCHLKAEQFHISNGTYWEPGFHPDDLYEKIGSSYEKAVEESENL